jgi:hypothetical protein
LLNVDRSIASFGGTLVRFGGTGGNVVNVSNNFAPTTFVSGVPIFVAAGTVANRSIGAGALVGLNTLGTVRINSTVLPSNAGPGSVTGSLITIRGTSGTVKIGP